MIKMDIPQSVLDLLKCDECDELLSCGPVLMMHDTGETVCGRCSHRQHLQAESENREKTRNNKYEAAAKLLRFPCSNAEQGCATKLDFSAEEPNSHELSCEFRRFICPMVSRGDCDWLGSWKTLKDHCRDKHVSQVLENPCLLPKPNLTSSNLKTYLISAFNFLFVLHVKVCVTSGMLFHSVRMFGDSKFLNNFSFRFIVEGTDINFSKLGSVFPAHPLTLIESTAICTKINLLQDIINGRYDKSTFRIKIQVKKCFYCSKEFENVSDSKYCPECDKKIVKCKYHEDGCLFADENEKKCLLHEKYFCQYPSKCFLCEKDFAGGSIFEHFESSSSCRKIIKKCKTGSVVRVTRNTTSNVNYILLSSNCNEYIVTVMLNNCTLGLWFWTSLKSSQLKHLKSSVTLTDPLTKYTETIVPQISYNNEEDWYIYMRPDNFISWESLGIDIRVDIGVEMEDIK